MESNPSAAHSVPTIPILPLQDLLDTLRLFAEELEHNVPGGTLSQPQIKKLLGDLQRLEEKDILDLGQTDPLCPICFTPYLAILAEEEVALAMDSPAHPIEELGVTKLAQTWQCGHIFCRRDISKWIASGHDSCPMCRRLLVQDNAPQEYSAEELAATQARLEGYARMTDYIQGQTRAMRRYAQENNIIIPEDLALMGNISSTPQNPEETNLDESDRQQFSGMYS
ncbi:hypothetical protein B0H34DRAFT_688988 [Crassisporium funariophilum]|nr:hypothetical protein B0H34DRAFT_688988 [Crassisporium funariophilum]